MKTVEELINIIKYRINAATVAYATLTGVGYTSEVLLDRDYEEKKQNQRGEYEEETPADLEDKNKLIFVVKFGRGEYNFALSSIPVTIEIISEENSLTAAHAICRSFVDSVNYRFADGIIQTYFLPSPISVNQEIYTGFRGILELTGKIYNFEDITSVVTKLIIDDQEIPFLKIRYDWSAQPNPQAFKTNNNGATLNINRQHTKTIGIVTYMWNNITSTTDRHGIFAGHIIEALNTNLNRKFHIKMETNVSGQYLIDSWFTLVNFGYDQALGTPSAPTLSFSECESGAVTTNEGE